MLTSIDVKFIFNIIARLSASLGDQAKKDCLVLQIFSQEQMSSEMSSCCSCYVFSQ